MVYVDDMYAPFGRMLMCHMVADTTAELVAMANRVGVSAEWIQKPGTAGEHFDVSKSTRKLAVHYGATEITWMQLGRATCVRKHPNETLVIPPRTRSELPEQGGLL